MELNEFIVKFAEQFDDTDSSEIKADTYYKELDEWSSLSSMCIIAMVKTDFKKTITGKEIRECDTVEDLYHLISEK